MDLLTRFLITVTVILAVCHLLGAAAQLLRQPRVVGEILGGLLLGPIALGAIAPHLHAWLFPPAVLSPLSLTAQLGLVLFVFLLGSELSIGGRDGRPQSVALMIVCAMGVPFAAGMGAALFARPLAGPAGTTGFALFLGLALSITALPVLARVLVDFRMESTRLGAVALTVAAAGDGVAWGVLAVITTVGSDGITVPVIRLGAGAAFVLVTLLVVRPAARAWLRRREDTAGGLELAILASAAIGFAAVAQAIGLHPLVGAFLFGFALPSQAPAVHALDRQLRGFTVVILLPLFFAGIGLNTTLSALGTHPLYWAMFAGVLAVAVVAKFAGAALGARATGWSGRDVVAFGVLMNCRGVTEIVIAGVGWQAGLINDLGLTFLILIAVITTAVTGPLLRRVGYRTNDTERADSARAETKEVDACTSPSITA